MEKLYKNSIAHYEYHLSDKYKAGIILEGWEIKAFRKSGIQLKGSYVKEINGEFWMIDCHINAPTDKDPTRFRKLLLNKHEIKQLKDSLIKGNTIVPLEAYIENNRLKIVVCVAKGKNKADKREAIKQRDLSRLQ